MANYLLQEDSSFLLQETNDKIILDEASSPAFDVGGKSTVQATVSSYSFSGPTLGTLTNGLVEVTVISRGAASDSDLVITGITYDSNAMTVARAQLESDIGGASGSLSVEKWYYKNPASGSKTIQITFTGTVNHSVAYVASFSNVDQTTPVNATAGSGDAENGSPTSTITQNITTTVDNCVLTDGIYHKIGTSLTAGASQTLITTESFPNGGGDTADASYKDAGAAGSKSMSYTLTGNDGWVICVVAYRPPGVAPPASNSHLTLLGVG